MTHVSRNRDLVRHVRIMVQIARGPAAVAMPIAEWKNTCMNVSVVTFADFCHNLKRTPRVKRCAPVSVDDVAIIALLHVLNCWGAILAQKVLFMCTPRHPRRQQCDECHLHLGFIDILGGKVGRFRIYICICYFVKYTCERAGIRDIRDDVRARRYSWLIYTWFLQSDIWFGLQPSGMGCDSHLQ